MRRHLIPGELVDGNTIRFVESFIAHVEKVVGNGDAVRGRFERLEVTLAPTLRSHRKSPVRAWRNVYFETCRIFDIAATDMHAGE